MDRINTVLLDCPTTIDGDTRIPVVQVPIDTLIFAQHHELIRVNRPAWFANAALACAYSIRNSKCAPHAFATTRACRLVDLTRFETVSHVLRVTSNEKHRAALSFATGLGMSADQQQRMLRRLVGSQATLRPHFFVLKGEDVTRVDRVFLGDTCFGSSEGMFNRIAIAKTDNILAEAIAHAFPWADGYASAACASTWHRHQLYPSEVCLFRPATVVVPKGPIPDYGDIVNGVQTDIDPMDTVFAARLGRVSPRPISEAPVRGDDDVAFEPDVESTTNVLTLDNPLVNNDMP